MNKLWFGLLLLLSSILSVNVLGEEYPPEVINLSKAIQIQTISHPYLDYDHPMVAKSFIEFIDLLEESYPLVFSKLDVKKVNKFSLLISWIGSNTELKPVLFDAHYDVVPIELGTKKDWAYPPFSGSIADGYLWGRGVVDDKASVIATLEAMERLLKRGFKPERTLLFSFVHDEEVGGKNGAAHVSKVIAETYGRLEYMIGEGGLIVTGNPLIKNKPMALIALAEKSYTTLTLTVKGEGGHSSTPTKDNALVILSKAVARLHDNPFPAQLISPVADMLKAIGEDVGGIKGIIFKNQWLTEPLILSKMAEDRASNALIRTTTAVTVFNSGVKENVIPQQATAKVNFRVLPGVTVDEFLADVTDIIDDDRVSITYERFEDAPQIADIQAKGYEVISSSIKKVLPDTVVVPGMMTATTDTPNYANLTDNIYRFHAYSMDMKNTKMVHGTNERLSLKAISDQVDVTSELISAAAKP